MKGSNLNAILTALAAEASNPQMYELSAYEAEAAYEIENYLTREGLADRGSAQRLARVASGKPAVRETLLNASRGAAPGGGGSGQGAQRVSYTEGPVPMAAQFDITVRRVTAAIAAPLPVVIFGAQDAASEYRNRVAKNLPAGVTLVGVRYGSNGVDAAPFAAAADRLVLAYTDGANTDTVEVTSSMLPYPSLLQSMSVDLLRISRLRYQLSDSAQQTQYQQAMELAVNNMFGRSSSNQLSPSSFLDPRQFQAGVRDIDGQYDVDKETGINTGIIAVAGFSFTLSMFVQRLYAQVTKGW